MDIVEDIAEIREIYGEPMERTIKKQLPRLEKHSRAFIALSPFLVIASADPNGRVDASPKGDMPGFVRVIDDQTLLIPDRLGNNRVDTISNLLASPGVGLIFFVPGLRETLRVNGQARITSDPALLEPCAVGGKVPRSGILITADRGLSVREEARAQLIQVLNKPVKPAALRALLAQCRVQRVAAAE